MHPTLLTFVVLEESIGHVAIILEDVCNQRSFLECQTLEKDLTPMPVPS